MKRLGLIGFPLSHSFSKSYFLSKFQDGQFPDWDYELYPLPDIGYLPDLIEREHELVGLNVTIPYKIAIMDFLQETDAVAAAVGAVNTVSIHRDKSGTRLKGYNTDVYGFRESIRSLLRPQDRQALVLGSGGASRAVCYALAELGISYQVVSRRPGQGRIDYADIKSETLEHFPVIINATPIGMYPQIEACPPLPYESIGRQHLLYDLVYNPEKTLFLRKGEAAGARTCGGLKMLYLQAEKAWEIWNADMNK